MEVSNVLEQINSIGTNNKKAINFYLPLEAHTKVLKICQEKTISVSTLMRLIVNEFLTGYEQQLKTAEQTAVAGIAKTAAPATTPVVATPSTTPTTTATVTESIASADVETVRAIPTQQPAQPAPRPVPTTVDDPFGFL